MSDEPRGRERRWVIVGADGRYVTLGRGSDPTEAEIASAEAALKAQGLGGWLAVMEGNPFVGPVPRLMEVRALAQPAGPFADAAGACIAGIRARRLELDQPPEDANRA